MTVERTARAFLWGALIYGALGALALVRAVDSSGRVSLLRQGAALVALAGVAAIGLWLSRPSGRVKA